MGFYHVQKVHEDQFHSETVIKATKIRDDEMDDEDHDIFLLAGKHSSRDPHQSFVHIPKGENYDWSKRHIKVRNFCVKKCEANLSNTKRIEIL